MVLFRAPDLASAGNILGGMVGLHGIGLPGARFGAAAMHLLDGVVPAHVFATAAATLLALLAIALLLPNSVQILSAYEPVLYTPKRPADDAGGAARRRCAARCSGARPSPGWCSSPPSPRCR